MNTTKHERLTSVLFGALAITTLTSIVLAMWIFLHLQSDLAKVAPDAAPQAPGVGETPGGEALAPSSTPTAVPSADDERSAQQPPESKTAPAPRSPIVDAESESEGTIHGDEPWPETLQSFTIGGIVPENLEPGSSSAIDLNFSNPHDYDFAVSMVRVVVSKVVSPRASPTFSCSADDFSVSHASFSPEIIVPAKSRVSLSDLGVAKSLWARVNMLNRSVNQDGCKGATITLNFASTGVRR